MEWLRGTLSVDSRMRTIRIGFPVCWSCVEQVGTPVQVLMCCVRSWIDWNWKQVLYYSSSLSLSTTRSGVSVIAKCKVLQMLQSALFAGIWTPDASKSGGKKEIPKVEAMWQASCCFGVLSPLKGIHGIQYPLSSTCTCTLTHTSLGEIFGGRERSSWKEAPSCIYPTRSERLGHWELQLLREAHSMWPWHLEASEDFANLWIRRPLQLSQLSDKSCACSASNARRQNIELFQLIRWWCWFLFQHCNSKLVCGIMTTSYCMFRASHMAAASLLTQRVLGRPLTMLLRCVVTSLASHILHR